jgi:phosphoribosylaminoimidazole carboxylase PurE protein
MNKQPLVGILMGSDNDYEIMAEAAKALRDFGVPFEMTVASAHRSPARTSGYVRSARERGLKVLIAGAGAAAHLAGVVAAETTLPVIAVPIDSSALQGLDALLAMVQMPAGIPVATMAIGKAGARNAGLFAVQILAAADSGLAQRLSAYKAELAAGVEARAAALQERLQRDGLG